MSHPDVSFIAASPLKLASVIFWEVLSQSLLWGVIGFFAGFLLGFGFQSGMGGGESPFVFSLFWVTSICCAVVGAWVVGVARLAISRNKNRLFFLLVCGGLLLVVLLLIYMVLYNPLSVEIALSPLSFSIGAGLTLIGISTLRVLSDQVDTIKAIEENILYADMYTLRRMPTYDLAGYSQIRVQKRVAKRGPILSLAAAEGAAALLARSALSHVRQFEGIPSIIFWGSFAAPMATILLLTAQSPLFWMIWAQILLSRPKGVREITRVFRDDLRNSLIRDHLPFSTIKLFLCDSALGFTLCTVISLVVTSLAIGALGGNLLLGIGLCLAANFALVFCAGVDDLPLFQTGKSLSYEIAVLVLIGGVFLISLSGVPVLSLGFLLLYSATLVLVMKYS